MSLTQGQINTFLERIGYVYDIPLFPERDLDRLVTTSREWEATVKKLQSLARVFAQYNLEGTKENISDETTTSKKLVDALSEKLRSLDLPLNSDSIAKLGLSNNDCTVDNTAPFLRDHLILDRVFALRPEYLVGTWFNREERPFKLNMEFDWVNRMSGATCALPSTPMGIALFASTGDHIWDFIDEVHIHHSATLKFTVPREGWIEAPLATNVWDFLKESNPLDFIERLTKVKGGRTIVQLRSGMGGWATFEAVRNHELTAAAARLLFRFSDPLYCARADGRVVIKLKDVPSTRAILKDMTKFPTARTLVNDQNTFPPRIQ